MTAFAFSTIEYDMPFPECAMPCPSFIFMSSPLLNDVLSGNQYTLYSEYITLFLLCCRTLLLLLLLLLLLFKSARNNCLDLSYLLSR